MRNQFATTTFKAKREALDALVSIWKKSVKAVEGVEGVNWALSIQPFPVAYSSKSASIGGNVLGLNPEQDGPMILVLVSYTWAREEDDEVITAAAQKLVKGIDENMDDMGCGSRFKYLNYAADWQDPFAGYGEENIAFLKGVAWKYDPEGIFQTRCPGGFKVSNERFLGNDRNQANHSIPLKIQADALIFYGWLRTIYLAGLVLRPFSWRPERRRERAYLLRHQPSSHSE